jgi:hypothetical protein
MPSTGRPSKLNGLRLCVALLIASACHAQDPPTMHWCTFNFGAGGTPTTPGDSSGLSAGWNFQAGAGFVTRLNPKGPRMWTLLITPAFLYDGMGVTGDALNQAKNLNPTDIKLLQANSAQARFYSAALDLKFLTPLSAGGLQFYGLAGFGWLRRTVDFSGVSTEGVLLQPGTPAVFQTQGNSASYDLGIGAYYRIGRTWMLYVEGRRVHGLAVNSGITLLPLTIGVRF